MLTYESASEMLANRETKKLARNTYLRFAPAHEGGERMVVKFWNTDIIEITPENVYTLNSGGYQTLTTKERLNNFSRARIGQEHGLWYVYEGPWANRTMTLFEDGMQVDSTGHVLSEVGCPDLSKYMRKVDRLVAKFISGYVADCMANGLQEDTSGDCWACLFVDAIGVNRESMGYDHYLSHFAEKYYVPSILLKGVQEIGYGNPAVVWHMMKAQVASGQEPFDLRRILNRFFRTRKLGIAKELAKAA